MELKDIMTELDRQAQSLADIVELNYWYHYGLDGTAEQAAKMAANDDLDGATALIVGDVLKLTYCDPNFKRSSFYDDDVFRKALTTFTAGRMFEQAATLSDTSKTGIYDI